MTSGGCPSLRRHRQRRDFVPRGRRLKHTGTYESQVKDAKFISHWGVLASGAVFPKGSSIEFYTRAGNSEHPDTTWSDWAGPYSVSEGSTVTSVPRA